VVPRQVLIVAVLLVVVLGAGGAGAATDQPLSLDTCLLSGDPGAAANCLHGQFGVDPASAVPALPGAPCTDAPAGRCPSWTAAYDDAALNGRSDQFPADMASAQKAV
jgi:hypothetical protein